jgi:hypothetical protein
VPAAATADALESNPPAILQLAMQGRARLENGHPRSPVIVLTGAELFASWHLGHAWKDKGGQHARFTELPAVHLENLWTLAELTQQLYLGLPGLWAHLRQPPPSQL